MTMAKKKAMIIKYMQIIVIRQTQMMSEKRSKFFESWNRENSRDSVVAYKLAIGKLYFIVRSPLKASRSNVGVQEIVLRTWKINFLFLFTVFLLYFHFTYSLIFYFSHFCGVGGICFYLPLCFFIKFCFMYTFCRYFVFCFHFMTLVVLFVFGLFVFCLVLFLLFYLLLLGNRPWLDWERHLLISSARILFRVMSSILMSTVLFWLLSYQAKYMKESEPEIKWKEKLKKNEA